MALIELSVDFKDSPLCSLSSPNVAAVEEASAADKRPVTWAKDPPSNQSA